MKLSKIIDKLNTLAPFKDALEWDNVGLLVGDKNADITGVFIALDPSIDATKKAKGNGCNLLLTHHPMLFRPIKSVTSEDFIGNTILYMAKNGINYVAMHTNFDVHIMGDIVGKRFNLEEKKTFDVTLKEEEKGIGIVGDLTEEYTLKELSEYVKDRFNLPFVSFYGEENTPIKSIAIVPGSGKSEVQRAVDSGVDVLITGDITHHEGLDAIASGLCIIDAGHYGLEHVFIDYMKEYIISDLPELKVVAEAISFPQTVI